jgi:hypothetical protein
MRILIFVLAMVATLSSALAQLCDQPFSPTRSGWEWQYRVSGERARTYSLRKTNISETGYTQIRLDPLGRQETPYRCSLEGLAPLDVEGSGTLRNEQTGSGGATYDLEVVKVSGVAVADYDRWEIGSSWKLVLEVKGKGQQGPVRFTLGGTLETTYRVVAKETITTPAGRFNTYKLQVSFAIKVKAMAGPVAVPINVDASAQSWWAENVGLVKLISKSQNGESTTELIALKK